MKNIKNKSIDEFAKEVHMNAVDHGWYDGEPRKPLEMHMLMVSEVAEASEEVRSGNPDFWYIKDGEKVAIDPCLTSDDTTILHGYKLEGESAELADVVIRVMDYFEAKGWSLEKVMQMKHNYNKTRPYLHGGKLL